MFCITDSIESYLHCVRPTYSNQLFRNKTFTCSHRIELRFEITILFNLLCIWRANQSHLSHFYWPTIFNINCNCFHNSIFNYRYTSWILASFIIWINSFEETIFSNDMLYCKANRFTLCGHKWIDAIWAFIENVKKIKLKMLLSGIFECQFYMDGSLVQIVWVPEIKCQISTPYNIILYWSNELFHKHW